MFSNNAQSVVILNIYILIIAVMSVVIGIYYIIFRDNYRRKKHEQIRLKMKPLVEAYLLELRKKEELISYMKNNDIKMIVIDLMIENVKKNENDAHEKFQDLNLDVFLMETMKKNITLDNLKKLIYMKTEAAYDFLIKLTNHWNIEVVYMSLMGLIMIGLSSEKKLKVAKLILDSEIPKERKIELGKNFDFSFTELMVFLKNEMNEEAKAVVIKRIGQHPDFQIKENYQKIIPYLKDCKEVRIETIHALSRIDKKENMQLIYNLYAEEEDWEVRVNIVKSLGYYSYSEVLDMLIMMIRDAKWWVRYNAGKQIFARGAEGRKRLEGLRKSEEEEETVKMADYFLNHGEKEFLKEV